MRDLRLSAPFWTRGNFAPAPRFELTSHFEIELTGGGDHDEFAVCMSALGSAIDAACSGCHDIRSGALASRERQSAGLAVRAISTRLVRVELMGRSRKAQRRASGISSLGGVRLDIGR